MKISGVSVSILANIQVFWKNLQDPHDTLKNSVLLFFSYFAQPAFKFKIKICKKSRKDLVMYHLTRPFSSGFKHSYFKLKPENSQLRH
jgi:hypothetical protein